MSRRIGRKGFLELTISLATATAMVGCADGEPTRLPRSPGGGGGTESVGGDLGSGTVAGESAGESGRSGNEGGPEGGVPGSAGGGPTTAPRCEEAALTESASDHTHLPATFVFFANFVNGSTATTGRFRLEASGTGASAHWHDIRLTADDVATLRAGGTITGKVSTPATTALGGVDAKGHTHTYTLTCF